MKKSLFVTALMVGLLGGAGAQNSTTSGGTLFLVQTSGNSREFSFDFSTLFTIPATFPQSSRTVDVSVECPLQSSSSLFGDTDQSDVDIFKKDISPTLLSNGIATKEWKASCENGKLTIKANSYADLVKRLELDDIDHFDPFVKMNLHLAFLYQNQGKSIILQGGNLDIENNKVTGLPTGGNASIAVIQGDGPLQPVLLEMKGSVANVDFSKPFLIVHSNENGKLWRNYLIDMPNATVTLWWSLKTYNGEPMKRLP